MSSDPIVLAEGDEKVKYLIVLTEKLLKQIFSFLSMVIIGVLMEDNLHHIFPVILISAIGSTVFHLPRKIIEAREENV